MNKFLARAAASVRNVFTADVATTRFLEQTHVDVRKSSRLWGV
jgi:hypothetical protein